MISLWGREEGPEYEIKNMNISGRFYFGKSNMFVCCMCVYVLCVLCLCPSAFICLSISILVSIPICVWTPRFLMRLVLGSHKPVLCRSRVTLRLFRSPLKWSPTLRFKALLWWKIYDLSIKRRVLGCQPLQPFWPNGDFLLAFRACLNSCFKE